MVWRFRTFTIRSPMNLNPQVVFVISNLYLMMSWMLIWMIRVWLLLLLHWTSLSWGQRTWKSRWNWSSDWSRSGSDEDLRGSCLPQEWGCDKPEKQMCFEHSLQEIWYTREGYNRLYVQLSTNCGLDKLLTVQILFSLSYKPFLQLVDSRTYGTIAFLFIKSSLFCLSKTIWYIAVS